MSFNLPLKDMSLHEKLAATESLWEDIVCISEAIESPAWHKDILDECRQRLTERRSELVGWETAKADIRNQVL